MDRFENSTKRGSYADIKRYLLTLLCALGLVGCGQQAGEIRVLKLAHGLSTDHPVHQAMVYMAERVAEKSDHTLRVDIYPNEQLGSQKECIERLQLGALAMTKTSSAAMEGFVEEMKVLGQPYIFRDRDHYWKVLSGPIGKELLAAGERKRLKGLCYYDAGARSFYTVEKGVHSPSDLKGVKVRVMQSPVAMDLVEALGGSPTPISWGELYTSLQQGVVDGAENNPTSFFTSRHYEVCKFYSLDEHARLPDILLISPWVWDRLTTEQQQWLSEAVEESVIYQKELWETSERQALEAVEAAGVTVIRPDKKPFREAVQSMLEANQGTALGDLIQRIREVE